MLIKGGHLTDTADDFYANAEPLIRGERVNNPNNHGKVVPHPQ